MFRSLVFDLPDQENQKPFERDVHAVSELLIRDILDLWHLLGTHLQR